MYVGYIVNSFVCLMDIFSHVLDMEATGDDISLGDDTHVCRKMFEVISIIWIATGDHSTSSLRHVHRHSHEVSLLENDIRFIE